MEMDSSMFLAGHQAGYGVSRGLAPQKRQWRSNGQNPRSWKKNKTASQQGSGEALQWSAGMYDPPRLMGLQCQNRIRTRRHFPKRRKSVPRVPPHTPFNDSLYLMRVCQSGGLASSASPATPATPATPTFVSTHVFVSPTPQFREGAEGDIKDDGYVSMGGLIHLKLCADEPSHASAIRPKRFPRRFLARFGNRWAGGNHRIRQQLALMLQLRVINPRHLRRRDSVLRPA